MQVFQLSSVNGSVVAVTNTATSLLSLINIAAGATQSFPFGLDAVDLYPEDGDIRILYDGNTPTASKGLLLKQGAIYRFRGIDLRKVQLIRTGAANVNTGVVLGFTTAQDLGDSASSVAPSINLGADIETAGADAKNNTANGLATFSRLLGFNGTTWDRLRTAISTATATLTGILNTLPLGIYNTTKPALTNGQVIPPQVDSEGRLIERPYADPADFIKGSTADITGTADTAVIAAQGAGVRIYVTQITVTNSHASVSTWVNIKDGATAIYTGYALAAGGGFVINLPVPLRLTANTALNAACETTGSNVRVSASGYKGA